MLDEKDLQAIKELLRAEMDLREERMKGYVDLIMENEVRPNFQLLAEGHATILQQITPRLDDAEQRIDHLETDVIFLKSAR